MPGNVISMSRGRERSLAAATVSSLVIALAAAAIALAADNVPTISDLHANPRTFCAKKSAGCAQPGTTIRFTVDSAATVRGVIRPKFEPQGNLVEFVRKFPKGVDRVRLNDPRLRPGTWVLRLQGRNEVGSGGVALIHLHVVKGG